MGQDPAQRAVPVRARQEVQDVPRPLRAAAPVRDFSDDIGALRRRLDEAEQYLRIDELRQRRPQLETEASRPDLWDDPERRHARSPASWRRSPTTSSCSTALVRQRRRRRDARRAGARGGRRDARSPRSPRRSPRVARDARRARAALAVHRRARRARRARARCRRARAAPTRRTGPRCCCACTCAGPSARLRRRARRGLDAGQRGRPVVGRVRGEGPLRLRLAARPSGACTASCACRRSTRRASARPRSPRSRSCRCCTRATSTSRSTKPTSRCSVPLVGRRRPARQQDRLGGAPHPPADRHRRCRARTSAASSRTGTGPCRC